MLLANVVKIGVLTIDDRLLLAHQYTKETLIGIGSVLDVPLLDMTLREKRPSILQSSSLIYGDFVPDRAAISVASEGTFAARRVHSPRLSCLCEVSAISYSFRIIVLCPPSTFAEA